MSASQLVPMLAPDGTPGYVPSERVQEATAAGGKVGVGILAPDGIRGVIPQDRVQDALRAGGKLIGAPLSPQVPSELTGKPEAQGVDPNVRDIGQMAGEMAKNVYQVSTPGIAASLLQKRYPEQVAKLPSALQPTPAQELPGQIAVNALPMLAGGLENPELGYTDVKPPSATPSIAPGAAQSLALKIARRLPVVGKFVRLGDLASDVADVLAGKTEAPATPAPAVPPWWGTSNVGPPEMWGKTVPVEPGGRPATPLPPPPGLTAVQTDVASALRNQGYTVQAAEHWARQSQASDFDTAFREATGAAKPLVTQQFQRPASEPSPNRADLWQDKSIEDQMRADLEQHGQSAYREAGQEFRAGSSMDVPKWQRSAEYKAQQVIAAADRMVQQIMTEAEVAARTPARYTTTVPPRVPAAAPTGSVPAQDLTPLLEQSIARARAAKKTRLSDLSGGEK